MSVGKQMIRAWHLMESGIRGPRSAGAHGGEVVVPEYWESDHAHCHADERYDKGHRAVNVRGVKLVRVLELDTHIVLGLARGTCLVCRGKTPVEEDGE